MLALVPTGWLLAENGPDGARIYRQLCAECHGPNGEGGTPEYRDRLVGDLTLAKLTSVIHKTMPEDDERACRDEDAAAVAKYMYDAFYSAEAQARNRQAYVEFSRLTVRQFEENVADLFVEFTGRGRGDPEKQGIHARYYASRGYDNKKFKFERVDERIAFHFGDKGTPQAGQFPTNEFSVAWSGSIWVEDTGVYEFNVKTENGFQLWVNDRETPLIDGYVASGGEPSDHRASIKLLGGRLYPMRLEWFKYKDKTASVELRWKPPHKAEEIIPNRNLFSHGTHGVMVVQTAFPPDDASVGYPRGTSISKAWNESVTQAALEVGQVAVKHLDHLSRSKPDQKDREQKVKVFCQRLLELAWRGAINEQEQKQFVDKQFRVAESEEEAVVRTILLALSSPRFLYPELQEEQNPVATRLALGLWDSLPDHHLREAAKRGHLDTRQRVTQQARRMLKDPRTMTKFRGFFHRWLMIDASKDIAKDAKVFPGFDERIVSDLRTSLDLFVEDVVWKGSADYRQLLLADELYLNARLAKWYGGGDIKGDNFVKVKFDPAQRSGVITHPYLLANLAYHQDTSPIHRGVFLTRNVLGRSLKPPPEAVLFEEMKFDAHLTMREKVTELTRPANCMTCHSMINPLGFSLENFDAIGRWRTHEKSKPIDAGGEYETEGGEKVPLNGARSLAEFASTSEAAQRNFIIQLFNEVAKQPVQAYGAEILDELLVSFEKSKYNIKELLVEIAVVAALHNKEV